MSIARQIVPAGDRKIPVASIRIDGGTQSRAMLQDTVIDDYAAAIKEGVEFPAVVIFYDGAEHWLADGFHRVRAFMASGIDDIAADVRQGTRRDAILYSVGANETHGLRRTNEDKRRAVLTLLNDPEWSKWSDREIARQCHVDHKFVAKHRPTLTGDIPSERTFTTKHGTTTTMNTAAIGKPLPKENKMEVAEIETAEPVTIDLRRGPKLSLPEGMTIKDVARQGMGREANGEDPDSIAKSLKISILNYRMACDVCFLFDRGGYSAEDTEIVRRAFKTMVDDQRISEAREIIDPVATKVWGALKANGRARHDREPARVDRFQHAFGVIMHTCASAAELDLPYLSKVDAKLASCEIMEARRNLKILLTRVEEVSYD